MLTRRGSDARGHPANEDHPYRSAATGGLSGFARTAVVFVAWTGLALVATTTAYLGTTASGSFTWLSIFQPMLRYFYIWGAAALLIFWLTPDRYPGIAKAAALLAAHVVVFAAVNLLQMYLLYPAAWLDIVVSPRGHAYFALGATVHILTFLASAASRLQLRGRREERRRTALAAHAKQVEFELSAAKLELIATQISPHFMFNALNGVAALIEARENERAYEMTARLGELLRTSLSNVQADAVPLADELRFVYEYIAVARIQIDREIELETGIDPACVDVDVPPMLLQPLVENAIKYRNPDRETPVQIDVRVVPASDIGIRIDVIDNGPGPDGARSRNGTGFGNDALERRLSLLFGDDAGFSISAGPAGGTQATINLPTRPAIVEAA